MIFADLKKLHLPSQPGVYFFRKGREILYIGKATALSDRTKSYFSNDLIATRGPLIIDMVTQADTVTWQTTDSVLEALILESALIKKHQPRYNIKEKDNKSYNAVIITDEEFPRVFVMRSRDLKMREATGASDFKIKREFGPFPNGTQLKEALKIVRKLFPFFDKSGTTGQSTLNVQLGLMPDIRTITRREYQKNIRNISLFFAGKKSALVAALKRDMKSASKKRDFETAERIKRTMFSLEHINDVSLISRDTDFAQATGDIFRIESYDIAHLGGSNTVGAMVVMENGELNKNEYRKFIIREAKAGDDYGALREVLRRRCAHDDWRMPNLIVIDGGKAQKAVVEKVLREFSEKGFDKISLVSVVKDEFHRAREILGDNALIEKHNLDILKVNAETHRFAIGFHRKRRRSSMY